MENPPKIGKDFAQDLRKFAKPSCIFSRFMVYCSQYTQTPA